MDTKEKKKAYKRYNKSLLDRIDNMPMQNEYSPYTATKKRNVSDEDLFDEEIYDTGEDESNSESSSNGIVICSVVAVLLIVVGLAVIVITRIL